MIRLFVVEDEPAILSGIRHMIAALGLPLEIWCFSGGRAALEQAETLRPDVILTDIRMPVMNGLQLIAESKKLPWRIEYIILSGYSDFTYAQTAIKYGVSDYILKPSTREELRAVLEAVVVRVQRRQEASRRAVLEDALLGVAPTGAAEGLFSPTNSNYLLLACLGPYSVHAMELIRPDLDGWSCGALESVIASRLGENSFCTAGGFCFAASARSANERALLLSVPGGDLFPVRQAVDVLKDCGRREGMPVTIALSEAFSALSVLPSLYHQARVYLSRHTVIGRDHMEIFAVSGAEQSPQPMEDYVAIGGQERRNLRTLLKSDDIEGVIATFLSLSAQWEAEKLPQAICEFSIKYLISELHSNYEGLQKAYSLDKLLPLTEAIVEGALSFQDLNDGVVALIRDVARAVRTGKSNLKVHDVVELLYDHIRADVTRPISIEQFAREFGYHATYLSNTFTSVKGISPNRLITNLRMEKARELLLSYDNPLKEIAEMLGYNDVSYFSRIFKEATGKSPKQYREGENESGKKRTED